MSTSEFELIQRCFKGHGLSFAREGVELGIGDDAALIRPAPGSVVALSLDTLVAGVHFPRDAAPELVANRALAVNLSDLAAMAAQPLCFTLGLTLPESDEEWVNAFARGLEPLAREFDCPLVGGDTTRGPLAVTIQVHGSVKAEAALRRSGAKAGDLLCVTGELGDGAAALLALGETSHLGSDFVFAREPSVEERGLLLERFYRPRPRVAFALRCAAYLSAGLDLSDGLAGDVNHLLQASGVGATLRLDALPYSRTLERLLRPEMRERAALSGGDDYELCFTVAPGRVESVRSVAAELGLRVTAVGEIETEPGLRAERAGLPVDLNGGGYRHF